MITFDFQQNLPTPNLHHSEVFYMRQMWMYNMDIHDFVGDQGPNVHVWRGCQRGILLPSYVFQRKQKWSKVIFPLNVRFPVLGAFRNRFYCNFPTDHQIRSLAIQMGSGQNKNQTLFLFLAHVQRSGMYAINT